MAYMDVTFGATYVGVTLATFLYGILTLQAYTYWIKYIHDSLFDRLFVVALWIFDTLQLIFIFHLQYHYTITNYANPSGLHNSIWSFSAEVGMTAIITFMVQAFFARRAWFFTRRVGCRFSTSRITKLLGAAICVLTFTQLGFGLAAFELTLTMKEINKVFDYRVIWVGWHASAAACDILIAYMLSSVLVTQRTGFVRTDALIDRLLLYTINTGLLTSLVAIVDLVAFCTMYNMVHLALNFALGKLYTNTLLATLNARDAEPQNIIHIEDGSYNLKGFTTHLTSGKFSHPQGAVASQVRSEPVAHIDPEVGLQSPDDETRRGSPDQTAHKVVMPGPKRVSDCDTDSIDTKDESVKQVKEV